MSSLLILLARLLMRRLRRLLSASVLLLRLTRGLPVEREYNDAPRGR